jgi:hypothetical protein
MSQSNRLARLEDHFSAREAAAEADRPRREIVNRWMTSATGELAALANELGIGGGLWPVSNLFTAEATPIRNALAAWMAREEVKWPGAVCVVLSVPGLTSTLNRGNGKDIQMMIVKAEASEQQSPAP